MIEKVAYFEPCPHCGTHGSIVYPDGTRSQDLVTKSQALRIVNNMAGLSLDEAEVKFLTHQINSSDLPLQDDFREKMSNEIAEFEAKQASGCRTSV
jgi:hypothetical protein